MAHRGRVAAWTRDGAGAGASEGAPVAVPDGAPATSQTCCAAAGELASATPMAIALAPKIFVNTPYQIPFRTRASKTIRHGG